MEHPPKHIAIIMDGNGRWAVQQGKKRTAGHRAGASTVRMVVEECRRLGVRYLTLFAFSSENWSRPKLEVRALMALFESHLQSEVELLKKHGIRLRAIGALERLPKAVQVALARAAEATSEGDAMDLVLAVSYGGRQELVSAARAIAARVKEGDLTAEEIDESCIASHLYAPDIPDPDLLVRTSGEMRISNFLLWQLAYAEIVTSECLWPDFSKEEFYRCIEEFNRRERRYGRTGEQL